MNNDCAQELVNMGVKRVVVCQVGRRQSWRRIMYEDGSASVTEITDILKTNQQCLDQVTRQPSL